jgi:hypothetical protein
MDGVEWWELEWDEANIEHLERHGITPDEVEEMFEGRTVRRRSGTDAPDRQERELYGRQAGR